MKTKIIPTIFALDINTFNSKLEKLNFSKEIHLDFMDKTFTENKTIQIKDMNKILEYKNTFFEIHLMTKNPKKYINEIKKLNISKVLIQEEVFESKEEIDTTIRFFKDKNLELFIVLNPITKINRIIKFLDLIDGIMVMSVNPGAEGQKFIENTYDKILEIREIVGEGFPIQIDGGINEKNIKKLIKSSAQFFSVGSYISSKENPKKSYNLIKGLI